MEGWMDMNDPAREMEEFLDISDEGKEDLHQPVHRYFRETKAMLRTTTDILETLKLNIQTLNWCFSVLYLVWGQLETKFIANFKHWSALQFKKKVVGLYALNVCLFAYA